MKETTFIGVAEAAQVLGVTRAYLYKLTYARLIPFYKPRGGKLLFDKEELVDFIRKARVEPDKERMMAAARRRIAENTTHTP